MKAGIEEFDQGKVSLNWRGLIKNTKSDVGVADEISRETLSKLGWTDPLDINLADRGVGGEVKNLLCQGVESEVVVNRPFSISL